ncbi:MAG: carbamate kinase [Firmicutes bacterium]|nr:carbamate kinase [Bacillota bacterium]
MAFPLTEAVAQKDALQGRAITVLAVGGNAIERPGTQLSYATQLATVRTTAAQLAPWLASEAPVVVVHGNGPQVGRLLAQNEIASEGIPALPLSAVVAESQGLLGAMLQQAFQEALAQQGSSRPVATILTQSIVAADDPAFERPTKPIGPLLSSERAQQIRREGGEVVKEIGGGWRRVVASPRPLRFLEEEPIRQLTDSGVVVIAAGGGGIPVVAETPSQLRSIDAVIDKDYAAGKLAERIGAQRLIILTAVEGVALDFGTPAQRYLRELTVSNALQQLHYGQFPPGSMGPKVEACVQFVRSAPGREAIIGSLEQAAAVLSGTAGTRFIDEPR